MQSSKFDAATVHSLLNASVSYSAEMQNRRCSQKLGFKMHARLHAAGI
jgi:hypothetical protein